MNKSSFWQHFTRLATSAGAKFPDCVAAQAALESGWGAHLSGKNNYFGIKGMPGTEVKTREVYDGKEVFITATFKDFASPEECVQYLVDRWYKDYKGYKGVNNARSRNDCAYALKAEGYATDPIYPQLLIDLMDNNQAASKADYFLEKASLHDKQEEHQIRAWRELEDGLTKEQLEAFKTAYRGKPKAPEVVRPENPLNVPYFYQRDSKTGHGERMCFSSSMAMAMDYLDPEAIEGDDDWYLREVFKFGDTVSSSAQIAAAESLGFNAVFKTDLDEKALEAQIDRGVPIPVGILHKNSISYPGGGGHWLCVIGYDETHFTVQDPFGELDLINGGYPKAGPEDGKAQRYSRKNFKKRWEVEGPGSGWGVIFR